MRSLYPKVMAIFLLAALTPSQVLSQSISLEKPGRSFALKGQREAASNLRLNDDGTYSFWFAVGGLDEIDDGKWRQDGDAIVLDSTYANSGPIIELLKQEKIEGDNVIVQIETDPVKEGINSILDVSIWTPIEKIRLENVAWRKFALKKTSVALSIEVKSFSVFNPNSVYIVPTSEAQANKFTLLVHSAAFNSPKFSSLNLVMTGDTITIKAANDYTMQYKLISQKP